MKQTGARVLDGGRRSGFTFIEIMLVVAMIAILAGVVAVSTKGKTEKARVAAAKTELNAITAALDTYEIDLGDYPPTLEGLITSTGDEAWDGPYLKKMPTDPWQQPYNYSVSGGDYTVSSSGKDKASGSEDDVTL